MKKMNLNEFGAIISSKSVGEKIYQLINDELKETDIVSLDLSDIKSMATFCAKQIFGKLYIELGPQKFFERIIIKNADDDLKTIIQIGIQNALEDINEQKANI